MSDDNYNDDLQGGMDPGIEARVVALVLGEVSGPEAGELERLMAEQPQLQEFKQRVETLHGLLGETVGPQDDEEWKLATGVQGTAAGGTFTAKLAGGDPGSGPGRRRVYAGAPHSLGWAARDVVGGGVLCLHPFPRNFPDAAVDGL